MSNFAGANEGYNADAIFKYRDEHMCHKWRNHMYKKFFMCDIQAMSNSNGSHVFNGKLKNHLATFGRMMDIYVQYWAPAKVQRGGSFNGSGLPFSNEFIAYQNTPNRGVVKVFGVDFTFNIDNPNSYYSELGSKLNPPEVKFRLVDANGKSLSKIYTVQVGTSIPYRSSTYLQKRGQMGPMFYDNKEIKGLCRNQFQILMESQFPSDMKPYHNFWGLKPPR